MTGANLLRGSRDTPLTWRSTLAWVSWGITMALAIGAAIDTRRAKQGRPVSHDSPVYAKQKKQQEKDAKKGIKPLKR